MMFTLVGLTANLTALRMLLGKTFFFDVHEGYSSELPKDHVMYNRFVARRLNRIIHAPYMRVTHKRTGKKFLVRMQAETGFYYTDMGDGIEFEDSDAYKLAKKIKGMM